MYVQDPNRSLEQKRVRFGSLTRAVLLAIRDLRGIEEISDSTYKILSERIREANSPGIYRRLLRDRCNIVKVINRPVPHADPV